MAKCQLVFVALLAVAGVASAASACGSLNFFPTAAQITGAPAASASVAVTSNVTCTGNNVCNWPPVLSKAAQEANLTALGTSISADGLLTVAVKEYGSKQLRFFFSPSSPLLTANANAQACVQATLPAAARRRLQAATYTVTSAGSWSYSVAFNTGGSVNGGDKAAGEVGDATLTVENTPDDKTYCAAITVTLKGYAISNTPAGFPTTIPLTYNVCWYKHNGQARADFDFNTCKNGTDFTVNVSNIAPLAQKLTQNGAALTDSEGVAQLLIRPVLQVFGRMNRTIEGVPVEEGASFVNKYFILPPNLKATDSLTLSLGDADALAEGYYHLSAKVAVVTKFPNLVDLQGRAAINQTDRDAIMGYTEYMGYLVRNGTDEDTPLIGLQAASRVPQISDISVDKEGVALKGGDPITFSWQFVAAGTERCFHDGLEVTSRPCVSPFVLTAKPFGADAPTHNFSVVITDVCGNNKTAKYSYSTDGAKAVSEIDFVDPNIMNEAGSFATAATSTTPTRRVTTASAAASTAAGALQTAALALLASALLAGALV